MNKKNMLKWTGITLGSVALFGSVAGSSIVLSSCSSSKQAVPFATKKFVGFNAKVTNSNKTRAVTEGPTDIGSGIVGETQTSPDGTHDTGSSNNDVAQNGPSSSEGTTSGQIVDLNPSTNSNAINSFKESLEKLAVAAIQSEFDNGLLQFFQANEFEIEGPSAEISADIKEIKVKNVKYNSPVSTLPSPEPSVKPKVQPTPAELYGTLTINADVTYEVETEKEARGSEKTSFDTQSKTITLTPQLAGKNEINEIVTQLTSNSKVPKDILEELKEIYFGDKNSDGDEDNDNELDNDFNKDWDDKGGVLNFLNNFINNVSPYAKMAGWNINISEVAYQPEKPNLKVKVSSPIESIWAPSSAISTIFYPTLGKPSSTTNIDSIKNSSLNSNDIDLSFDMRLLKTKTISDWFKSVFTETVDSAASVKIPGSSGISTWTAKEKINKILANLKQEGGIMIPENSVSKITIDASEFAEDGEVEIKITTQNVEYELDIQSSWFKKQA